MLAELGKLIELQNLDNKIQVLNIRLNVIPKEINALQQKISNERANLREAQEQIAESNKLHRAQEGELSDGEIKIQKYKDQLMQVKSNEEYNAMQKQIAVAKQDMSKLETSILLQMDEIEKLQAIRNQRQSELDAREVKIARAEKELESEKIKLENKRSDYQNDREKLVSTVPKELLGIYEQIAKTREGIAMAAAIGERCQVCMVRMRPQIFAEIRLGKIHTCDSCSRILYFMDTATISPQ